MHFVFVWPIKAGAGIGVNGLDASVRITERGFLLHRWAHEIFRLASQQGYRRHRSGPASRVKRFAVPAQIQHSWC